MLQRILLILFIVTRSIACLCAQDTVFYDGDWVKVKSKSEAEYYKVVYKNKSDTNKATVKEYLVKGQLLSVENYSSYSKRIYDGETKTWYQNGQLKADINYIEDSLNGDLITYWYNGTLKRKDKYNKGDFITGECYDSAGRKVTHYDYQIMPKFIKGNVYDYIADRVKYPKKERRKGIEGKVIIKFIVEKDGSVSNVTVLESSRNENLDKEALRVISSLPKWSPGMQDGNPVRVSYNIPIRFNLK